MQIAIDGPAGAGKSTVAKMLADQLGILYVDTGAMYRALTLAALNAKVEPVEGEMLKELLRETHVMLFPKEDGIGVDSVLLNGQDVTEEIRAPHISEAASHYSALPSIREKLTSEQQAIAEYLDVIMDGRDIGSVVLPNATHKFFLTASPEERAQRRFKELAEKGIDVDIEKITQEIIARDEYDSHRDVAPLIEAEDAIRIVTDNLSAKEVCEKILSEIRK